MSDFTIKSSQLSSLVNDASQVSSATSKTAVFNNDTITHVESDRINSPNNKFTSRDIKSASQQYNLIGSQIKNLMASNASNSAQFSDNLKTIKTLQEQELTELARDPNFNNGPLRTTIEKYETENRNLMLENSNRYQQLTALTNELSTTSHEIKEMKFNYAVSRAEAKADVEAIHPMETIRLNVDYATEPENSKQADRKSPPDPEDDPEWWSNFIDDIWKTDVLEPALLNSVTDIDAIDYSEPASDPVFVNNDVDDTFK